MATLFGRAGGSESITGSASDDEIYPNTGFDLVDGGDGLDTVVFVLNRAKADLSADRGLFFVDTVSGASGQASQTRMKNVERLLFNDAKVAVDTAANQHGGETALLIGAVIGPQSITSNKELNGAVLGLFDAGFSMLDLSGAVMRLNVWGTLMSGVGPEGATNQQIASYLLTTVNGVTPGAAELAAGVAALDSETPATQGAYLASLATSVQNQAHVNLVGLGQTGILYV